MAAAAARVGRLTRRARARPGEQGGGDPARGEAGAVVLCGWIGRGREVWGEGEGEITTVPFRTSN